MKKHIVYALFRLVFIPSNAQKISNSLKNKVIKWRHHIHQNPELSNREYKTAILVERHLKSLGIEVRKGIAKTGVVGILKGTKPGTDEELDFPVIYASAIEGISGLEAYQMTEDMTPLIEMILDKVPAPEVK